MATKATKATKSKRLNRMKHPDEDGLRATQRAVRRVCQVASDIRAQTVRLMRLREESDAMLLNCATSIIARNRSASR